MSNEADRKHDLHEVFHQAWTAWGPWQTSVKRDLRAYAGNPWTAKDREIAKKRNKELMSFPQLRRCVKFLTGYEREHRLSIIYDPQENGDTVTASQLTNVGIWSMQHKNNYHVISDAFEGALKTGINLINVYNDRNSNTRFARFMYNQFVLDPSFTRVDLEDCRYGIMRKYISKADAKMILPGKESLINGIDSTQGGGEELFTNYPRPELFGEKLLYYDEFQQRETVLRNIVMLKVRLDPRTQRWVPGMTEVVFKGTKEKLKETIRQIVQKGYPPNMVSVVKRYEPTVKVTRYLNGREVGDAIDPYGLDDFSFVPVVCYLDPEQDTMVDKVVSFIHPLVTSQRAADKRMMAMISWFEQQAGSGLDYEQGALVDERDAMVTGSGHPRQFKKGAIEKAKYRDRTVPGIPAGAMELWESISSSIPQMANINPTMFGQPANDNVRVAGFLEKLRMGAGLIGLRDILDNREVTVKMCGGKMNKLFQQYPPSKIRRILGKEPTNEFWNRNFGKYDCAVGEGRLTDTQKAMAYGELLELKELGQRTGDPCPITWRRLVESGHFQHKAELLEDIERAEQAQKESQQKVQALQDELQKLTIQKMAADIAQTKNLSEQQRTAAIENQTEAQFDRVATAEKVQNMKAETQLKLQDEYDDKLLRLLGYVVEFEKIKAAKNEVREVAKK